MKREDKDFKIVFIQGKDASKEEKQAVSYAIDFATILGFHDIVCVVSSEADVPEADEKIVLDSTDELAEDKEEENEQKVEKEEEQKVVANEVMTTAKPLMTAACKKTDDVVQKKETTNKKVDATKPIEKVFFKIIVPNYNNIAYIKKCLDSILE